MGDDARRQAHVRRAHRAPGARRRERATRSSATASTSSSRARSPAPRSSPRSRSSTSSTQEGDYDLLVLDTPPSRNALDFLDAPGRLTGFFQGRAIRIFLRPAGLGGRSSARGTGVVFSLLKRVTGVDLLEDLSVFFRSLGGLIDGFTERARARRRAARGSGDDVPARDLAASTTRSRRRSSSTASCARRGCRSGAGRQPRARGAGHRRRGPGRARRGARRGARRARRRLGARAQAALAARDARGVDHLRERSVARRRSSSPSSRTTCTTSRGSPACEPICSGSSDVAARRLRRLLVARRSRLVGRASRSVAGRGGRRGRRAGPRAGREPSSATCASTAGSARDAPGDRGALQRDRLAQPTPQRVALLAAPRRSRRAGRTDVRRRRRQARPGARAPTAASPSAPPSGDERSQPSSNRRSAHASSPARGVRRAIKAQNARSGSSSSCDEQAVVVHPAQAGGERDRQPRAAVGARPRDRAEGRLGVVPQAQRGLQPAQAAAGLLEPGRLAGRGLETRARRPSRSRHRAARSGCRAAWCRARARGRRRAGPRSESITRPSTGASTTLSEQPS